MLSDDAHAAEVARALVCALTELDAGRRVADVLPQVMAALLAAQAAGRPNLRVEAPAAGEPMTTRELEVLLLLAEGHLARSIAARLDLSPRTVHKHLGSVYRKLGVHDRLVAVRTAQQCGLIPLDAQSDDARPPLVRRDEPDVVM